MRSQTLRKGMGPAAADGPKAERGAEVQAVEDAQGRAKAAEAPEAHRRAEGHEVECAEAAADAREASKAQRAAELHEVQHRHRRPVPHSFFSFPFFARQCFFSPH